MRILLIDDHAIVLQGFSSLLKSVLTPIDIDTATNSQQAMLALREKHYELVIVDINLGDDSGLTLCEHALKRWPELQVLVFSMFDDIAIIDRAMKLGAMGYVSKQSDPSTLVAAVTAVTKGKRYLEHKTAIELATYHLASPDLSLDNLTQREFDIFIGVAKGNTRASIAASLSVSEKTVSNMITQLKRKLSLHTNTAFVYLAVQQGYIKIAS